MIPEQNPNRNLVFNGVHPNNSAIQAYNIEPDAAKALAAASITPESDEDIEYDFDGDTEDDEVEAQEWKRPAGLVGDIAEYVYQSSVYPNIEVSLGAGIVLMSGIAARQFNTDTFSGLNQYLVLLAGSGVGKEGMARGVSRIYKAVREQLPVIADFAGPAEIASAPALIKHLAESPCCWSHKSEFGIWLQKMNHKYANANDLALKGALLDLFHKSGRDDLFMGSIYSDKKNKVPSVDSPALTLVGDSTPNEFYKAVDENSIRNGLVSRLTVLPVPRIKAPYYPNNAAYNPPPDLVNRIVGLAKRVCDMKDKRLVYSVPQTWDANAFQLKYQEYCANKNWHSNKDASNAIWGRNHIKLLRLGALIAVGVNPDQPEVQLSHYEWAKTFIEHGAVCLQKRFRSHLVGADAAFENIETKQMELMRKRIKAYAQKPYKDAYRVSAAEFSCNVISMHYLRTSVANDPLFKDKDAIERTANRLVEAGDLKPIARESSVVKIAKLYQILLIDGKPPTRFLN